MTTPHRRRILGDMGDERARALGLGRAGAAGVDAVLLLYATRPRGARGPRRGADGGCRAGGLRRVVQRLGHLGSGRLRALRLPRRHLAADRRGALGKTGPRRDTVKRGRVRPRLPERVRPLHRAAAVDRPRPQAPAARREGPAGRPRPQRQLPRPPPAAAGRARLLALRRRRDADGRRAAGPGRRERLAAKMVGRWPSGAPLVLAPDADDPALADGERLRLPRDDAAAPAARSARTSGAPTRATRSTRDPGSDDSLARQQAAPAAAPRPRVRPAAHDRRRARAADDGDRARPPLHLPEREHRPPVRVRPAHLAEQPEVRRAVRRHRPARRPRAGRRARFTVPAEPRPRALTGVPRFVTVQGRRLLLPARAARRCATWRRWARRVRGTSRRPSARSARPRSSAWRSLTAPSTSAGGRGSGCPAAGARAGSARGCT